MIPKHLFTAFVSISLPSGWLNGQQQAVGHRHELGPHLSPASVRFPTAEPQVPAAHKAAYVKPSTITQQVWGEAAYKPAEDDNHTDVDVSLKCPVFSDVFALHPVAMPYVQRLARGSHVR